MQIKVGLKTGDLIHLEHSELRIKSGSGMEVRGKGKTGSKIQIPAGQVLVVRQQDDGVVTTLPGVADTTARWRAISIVSSGEHPAALTLVSAATIVSVAKPPASYRGVLEIVPHEGGLRVTLDTDLESYVQGVLQSEVPSYFKLEAMKAQAVLARTYGIRPRLSHADDGFNVCDSYLHCQAFYGVRTLTAMQQQAIAATKGQLLLYKGQPALVLFSACAGGHTEDYQNCFSDPVTNQFPSNPVSYLTGVPEGKLPKSYPSEAALRELFKEPDPQTDDAWSMGHFRWSVNFSANALESHMHHVVEQLQLDPQFAPFIRPPSSGKFGHIERFEINRRGVAGTAITMTVQTSTGPWEISKELTIRSVFGNPDLKLKRLKSARIFFDHTNDSLGLLASLVVHGFGSGHGVGLQQIGAQGLASRGLNYKQIISHYYPGAEVGAI